jgi:hypothetical protein
MPDTMRESRRSGQVVDGERGAEAADDPHRVCLEHARRTLVLSGWQLDAESDD